MVLQMAELFCVSLLLSTHDKRSMVSSKWDFKNPLLDLEVRTSLELAIQYFTKKKKSFGF